MQFILNSELKKYINSFDSAMSLTGKTVRELEGRRTQRITLGGKNYFIKQHFGVGWKEIFKNLFQLRLPVLSAKNEWHALQKLQELKIDAPETVGYGCSGFNPATRHSFLITRELPPHSSLEDFCKDWAITPPPFYLKQAIIQKIALISRTLHNAGINHRDFYICHFLLDSANYSTHDAISLYLIDLHRAQIRSSVPTRWLIKDLAGLYFSSKNRGLTSRDLLRFIKIYREQTLRHILKQEFGFWQKIKNRGERLYQQHEK